MNITIVGDIHDIETISSGRSIRELSRLRKSYGEGRWRKLKGTGTVVLPDGMAIDAELHWYEASGIGRKEMKVKRIIR